MTRLPDFSTTPRRSGSGAADLLLLGISFLALYLAAQASWSAWRAVRLARSAAAEARMEVERASIASRALEASRGGDVLAARALLTAEAPPPRVLADLESVLPSDVRLEAVVLTYADRLTLELQVAARRGAAYDEFLTRLGTSARFGDVFPASESRGGEVKASVRATYRGVAGL